MKFASFALAVLLLACGGTSTPTTPSPTSNSTPQPGTANCSVTTVGLTPLNDLISGSYKGEPGGLYPGRTNLRPAGHDAAGLAIAKSIGPRGACSTIG